MNPTSYFATPDYLLMSQADLAAYATYVLQEFLRSKGADESELLDAMRTESEDARRARLTDALGEVFKWDRSAPMPTFEPAVARFGDWLPIETAPKDGLEVIVGRPNQPCEEDGSYIVGCVCVAIYQNGKWFNEVPPDLRESFGDYMEVPGVTSWTPWPELPAQASLDGIEPPALLNA